MNKPVDMSAFIEPKSDQLNADDLIAGPRTIRISRVSANEGSPEQPISINFEGDDGKPYKPCKSMRRVMVHLWGSDASKYVGRAMQLYRDPKVQFGGMQVGGIRISHMTDIPEDRISDGKALMALTATRGKRAPYVVRPLAISQAPPPPADAAEKWAEAYIQKLGTLLRLEAVDGFAKSKEAKLAELKAARPELNTRVVAALDQRRQSFSQAAAFSDDDDVQFSPATGGTDSPAEAEGNTGGDVADSAPTYTLAQATALLDKSKGEAAIGSALAELEPLVAEADVDALRQHAAGMIDAAKKGETLV